MTLIKDLDSIFLPRSKMCSAFHLFTYEINILVGDMMLCTDVQLNMNLRRVPRQTHNPEH